MRFDGKNLGPLYVHGPGKPGSSFSLEIARKTGLTRQTLESAEKLVGKARAGVESVVGARDEERKEMSERIKRMEKQEADFKQSLSKYQTLSAELESKKKEIINKAKEDASELLRDTNRQIEKTIRHIRENRAEKKETIKVRKNL